MSLAAAAVLAAMAAAGAEVLPGFRIELFDGETGTISIASGEFAAPAVSHEGERTRLAWRGQP